MFRTLFLAVSLVLAASASFAEPAPRPSNALIDEAVIAEARSFIEKPIVWKSVIAHNQRFAQFPRNALEGRDAQWLKERESDDQPLIANVLTSPLSSYLTRIQARSLGLYFEIFIMDANGLNVGQSAITTDYWQGDEAKFQKTFAVGPDAVFVDEAEYDAEKGIWRAQINMTIADPEDGSAIGAATVEVNLTELARRRALGLSM